MRTISGHEVTNGTGQRNSSMALKIRIESGAELYRYASRNDGDTF